MSKSSRTLKSHPNEKRSIERRLEKVIIKQSQSGKFVKIGHGTEPKPTHGKKD